MNTSDDDHLVCFKPGPFTCENKINASPSWLLCYDHCQINIHSLMCVWHTAHVSLLYVVFVFMRELFLPRELVN